MHFVKKTFFSFLDYRFTKRVASKLFGQDLGQIEQLYSSGNNTTVTETCEIFNDTSKINQTP